MKELQNVCPTKSKIKKHVLTLLNVKTCLYLFFFNFIGQTFFNSLIDSLHI